MMIVLYCLCAIALVLTGAVISGGLRLPARSLPPTEPANTQEDLLTRELHALLQYGNEEHAHEI